MRRTAPLTLLGPSCGRFDEVLRFILFFVVFYGRLDVFVNRVKYRSKHFTRVLYTCNSLRGISVFL